LESVATLPGVVRVVVLLDLHPGKTPVGVVLETEGSSIRITTARRNSNKIGFAPN
jgi:hypothetical protein